MSTTIDTTTEIRPFSVEISRDQITSFFHRDERTAQETPSTQCPRDRVSNARIDLRLSVSPRMVEYGLCTCSWSW